MRPDMVVTSPPVHITVGGSAGTVVRIEANSRIAEEDSSPLDRMPLRGVLPSSLPRNDQSLSVLCMLRERDAGR